MGVNVNSERTNYARIVTLLMEEGTARIRTAVLGHLKRETLVDSLAVHQQTFQKLVRKNVLGEVQYEILFPDGGKGAVTDSKIDMTLWVILARNITMGCNRFKWNSTFSDNDKTWQHDVLRIKQIRNKLFHLNSAELRGESFTQMWGTLSDALLRLGTSQEQVDRYFEQDLDPHRIELCQGMIERQCLREHNDTLSRSKRHHRAVLICLLLILVGLLLEMLVSFVVIQNEKSCARSAVWQKTSKRENSGYNSCICLCKKKLLFGTK